MNFKKLICIILLTLVLPINAMAADDSVSKLEKLILKAENASNKGSVIYFNEYGQAWAKRCFTVSNLKFDVKKTDSLVTPIVGFVNFDLITDQTDLYQTKEEAEASKVFDPKFITPYQISLTYTYRNGKWSFSKGSYESLNPIMKGKTFSLTKENIISEPNATPNAALKYWFTK
jgi:hypothetical protein